MLLERETFLQTLDGPPGRLILVGSEAGVGKTALVREAGMEEHVARAYCNLSSMAVQQREHSRVGVVFEQASPTALARTSTRGGSTWSRGAPSRR